MKLKIKPKALSVLNRIAFFVESKNTPGSGKRFISKFIKEIEKIAQPNVQYQLCNNEVLARNNYSCWYLNNWVIAFKVEGGAFIVYDIIPGSILT